MFCSSKQVFFEDYVFRVYASVYEPAEDSFLFAECLTVEKGEVVLDMGTGCGILGIVIADQAAKVVAVDINPYAVRCAKENAKLNSVVDKLFFVQGDLLSSIKEKEEFDLLLFNAPYLPLKPSEDESWLERAWAGGTTGRQVIDRFICKAPKYLKEDGRILLMQSTLSNVDETLRGFGENGLKASIVAKRPLPFFETIVLVKAEK
ncbi:methyltransferase [Candidatus Bathyarchaeota archaeon]|nr:methyltransferase [Candidatus Bathyarchaeota archaeon]